MLARPSYLLRKGKHSWGSVVGPIHFDIVIPDRCNFLLCNVLDVHITTGGCPTGIPVSGQLTLREPSATASVSDIEYFPRLSIFPK